MGRVSGMEISSPPKISPQVEKLASLGPKAHGRQGFSSHRLISRWNFHNVILILNLSLCTDWNTLYVKWVRSSDLFASSTLPQRGRFFTYCCCCKYFQIKVFIMPPTSEEKKRGFFFSFIYQKFRVRVNHTTITQNRTK